MNTKKIEQYLLKLKKSFLNESIENKKMLDAYINLLEGNSSEKELQNQFDAKRIVKLLP